MADEATVRTGLTIRSDNLVYDARPNSFLADVPTGRGPAPGLVQAPLAGVAVTLTALSSPGLCRIMNLGNSSDPTNENYYVVMGMYDPSDDDFMPMLELLPGESYVIRLTRLLGQEFDDVAGTGTVGANSQLMVKSVGGVCDVLIEAFERA